MADSNNKMSFPHPNKQICAKGMCLYTEDLATKQIDEEKCDLDVKTLDYYMHFMF